MSNAFGTYKTVVPATNSSGEENSWNDPAIAAFLIAGQMPPRATAAPQAARESRAAEAGRDGRPPAYDPYWIAYLICNWPSCAEALMLQVPTRLSRIV